MKENSLKEQSTTLKKRLNKIKKGLLFAFLFTQTLTYAQTPVELKGKITSKDGGPIEHATVRLQNKSLSVLTDEDGNYLFSNLKPADYTIHVSAVGYKTQEQNIKLNTSEIIDFSLIEKSQYLKDVDINGSRKKAATDKESEYVARLPIKNLENPQTYSIVGEKLITQQLSTTLDEAMRNIPGAVISRTGAGIPAITVRGFTSGDNLRNGMATWLKTNIDPITVERVEAIKGPSSTLFGSAMVNFGGLVNYVIKRPYQQFGGEIAYTTGSFDLSRLSADINLPLNQDQSLLLRITGAIQKENSFQDQGFQHSQVISPSLSYKINDRLSFELDADLTKVKGTSSILLTIPTTLFNGQSFKDLAIGYKQSLIDNSMASAQASNNLFLKASYKLSENWKSQTSYTYSLGTYDQYYQFNYSWTTANTINRRVSMWQPDKWGRKQIQENITGDFSLGGIRNRILIGVDYLSQYRQMHYGIINLDNINLNQPIANISATAANNAFAALNPAELISRQDTYSAYGSNLINFTDNLMLLLSIRADRFLNRGTISNQTNGITGEYNQTAFSPKLGLVYQPIKDKLSLFANYMNGFKNVANIVLPNNTLSEFKPQQATQWEGGVKAEITNKLSATLSYYDISVKNSIRFDATTGYTLQDGTQKSKGVDFDLSATPTEGLTIIAGYGYNDNKYTKAAAAIEGKRATLSPYHSANLWISYEFKNQTLNGLGIGIGGNYVSDSYFINTRIDNNTTDYTFTLPSYTFIDASLFYDKPKYRISIKGNNIGNTKSWAIDGRPQKPANYLGSLAFKF